MEALRVKWVDADSFYCDSGELRHITPNKQYFVSGKIIHSWNMWLLLFLRSCANCYHFHDALLPDVLGKSGDFPFSESSFVTQNVFIKTSVGAIIL